MAIRIVEIPVALLSLVSHLVLGILFAFTFGLALIAVSLVYVVAFLGPLIGLSWIWLRVPALRLPVALVGVPWAFIGNAFVALVPVYPDERDSGTTKLLLTAVWPYSLLYWQRDTGRLRMDDPAAKELELVLERQIRRDPVGQEYVARKLGMRPASAPTQQDAARDQYSEQAGPSDELAELLGSYRARPVLRGRLAW